MSTSNFHHRASAALAITAMTLLCGFTSLHLSGYEKKAPSVPAGPAVTKADIVGTWRLAPGGEYGLARFAVRFAEKEQRVRLNAKTSAELVEELMQEIKSDPPVVTFKEDTTFLLKFSDEEFRGTFSINTGQLVMTYEDGETEVFDYTDRTLDSRDPDPKMPTFRLFKD
jgi:hypothetical protein